MYAREMAGVPHRCRGIFQIAATSAEPIKAWNSTVSYFNWREIAKALTEPGAGRNRPCFTNARLAALTRN